MTHSKKVLAVLLLGAGAVVAACNAGPEAVGEQASLEAGEGQASQEVVVQPVGTCSCIVSQGWSLKAGSDTCSTCTSSADCSDAGCVVTKDSNPLIEQRSSCKWSSSSDVEPLPEPEPRTEP